VEKLPDATQGGRKKRQRRIQRLKKLPNHHLSKKRRKREGIDVNEGKGRSLWREEQTGTWLFRRRKEKITPRTKRSHLLYQKGKGQKSQIVKEVESRR